ncbi:TPR-like protein [Marasmius fiardii PR-910]|nr:TPR-like protein [Marasmius fiardii PR-910]
MDHKRPSRPEFCENLRDSMWDLMQACWKETISLRPTMTDVLIRIEEMNVDRRLEPASNWRNPIFTQIWNDIKRPPVVQTGDSNSSEIGDHDRAGEDLSSDEAHFDPEILSLRQLVNQQEDNGEAWKALGHCYLAHGHLQEAYSAYRQALSLLPNSHEDPKLWYGIGVLYDRYGYLDPAEKAFSWVLAMDEEFDQANEIFFRLGILYKQQGKYEESLRCFDRTLWNPPTPVTPADIWFQIGHVHEQQRNHAQAKHAYERAIDKHPRHAKVLQQLGWLYHQDGSSFQNQDLAIQYFTKSLRADSSDAQSWYLLGRAYMADQKYSQACEAYQQAVYRDDQNPAFWRSIGKLYFQINQFRDAFDAYSRTIKINPYISGVWFDLGLLYEKWNNQISNAIDAYAHSLALDPGNTMISERLQLLKQARVTGGQVPEASGSQDVPAAAYRSSDEFQGMDARGPVGAAGSGSAPANENSLPPPSSSTPSSQSRVNGYGDHTTRSPPGPPPVIFDGRHLQTVQVASMGI